MQVARGTFVIAEAGVNHNGSPEAALELIDVAAEAGADAIKFQTAIPAEVATTTAAKAGYQERNTGTSESQLEMLEKLFFGDRRAEVYRALAEHAAKRRIGFLSTPFDLASLRYLHGLGLRTIKIASGDLTYGPLLLEAARLDCDIILSTGMGTLDEIEVALGVIAFGYASSNERPSLAAFRRAFAAGRATLQHRVTLLHCVTSYPAPADQINLRAMDAMRERFDMRVGYSDHTLGTAVSIAAVARGATMIEKHFTMSRKLPGPDHAASLEPDELRRMIADIRAVETSLGSGVKEPQPCEIENIPIARRGLVARGPVAAGATFDARNVAAKRPAKGLSPMHYWDVEGRTAKRDYDADEPIEG